MSLGFHHTIKGNQNNERPRHLIVFDVESRLKNGEKNRTYFEPFLWTAIYQRFGDSHRKPSRTEIWGTTIQEFWDRVEHYTYNKEKTILSSHHLEPDFIPLQGIIELPERGWKLSKYINHNKILIFEFAKDKKRLSVVNSGNIFPGSIASWGESLGLPKINMPDEKAALQEWLPYCMRDSEVLLNMWLKYIEFLDLHDLGNLQYTAASQAMTSYRHRFMETEIAIHHHPESMALERAAYHGGRFQALAIGRPSGRRFWRVDINSMYGQIMRDEELPYELRGYDEHCSLEKFTWLLQRYQVIAEVTAKTNEPFFPVIIEGKIKYKSGTHTTVLCTPEIKYLLKHGKIIKTGRVSWYRYKPIFAKYADYFMSLRSQYKKERNPAFEKLAKLFVNSLYGKFGQYGYEDKVIGTCDLSIIRYEEGYNIHTKKTISYFLYGGKIHVSEKIGNSYNTFVAIAAHITAYGRLRLWSLMKQAGIENVFHVATDSLIVNGKGLLNLDNQIHKSKIGALKIEEEFKSITIKAPNDMTLDGIEKIKGVSKKAKKTGKDSYEITQWPRFNTLLKRGELASYYTVSVNKTLKRTEFNSLSASGRHVKVLLEYPTSTSN